LTLLFRHITLSVESRRKGDGITITANAGVISSVHPVLTFSGDATGSGATAVALTLASVGAVGTWQSVTVDAKGRVTAGTNLTPYTLPAATSTTSGGVKLATGTPGTAVVYTEDQVKVILTNVLASLSAVAGGGGAPTDTSGWFTGV